MRFMSMLSIGMKGTEEFISIVSEQSLSPGASASFLSHGRQQKKSEAEDTISLLE
jgi:hypothetical protein